MLLNQERTGLGFESQLFTTHQYSKKRMAYDNCSKIHCTQFSYIIVNIKFFNFIYFTCNRNSIVSTRGCSTNWISQFTEAMPSFCLEMIYFLAGRKLLVSIPIAANATWFRDSFVEIAYSWGIYWYSWVCADHIHTSSKNKTLYPQHHIWKSHLILQRNKESMRKILWCTPILALKWFSMD